MGVVTVPLDSGSTYEYEVCVTTEMPPSGRVEVSVAVTRVEEGVELFVGPGVVDDVLRVVPSLEVVDEAGRFVSKNLDVAV